MYHPTSRVLTVLALLQSHGRMTGTELAQRLEVNIRTLRRYITMLQDLGIPIVAERGRNGRYELTSGYKLPPMMFTNDEALALSIGLLTARRLGLDETVHAIESAQAKLEQVLPADLKSQVRALTETITLDLDMPSTDTSRRVLVTMSNATQLRRRVHMRYRSERREETERDFDPYGLVYRLGHWYVVGACRLRRGLRSFRLDRVVQVDVLDIPFERPADFDALAFMVESMATLPRRFAFEILLKADMATAQHEVLDMMVVLETAEAGVLMRGSADDLEWLAQVLAGLPFDFEVHSPEALHHALRRRAERLLAMVNIQNVPPAETVAD